MHGTGLCQAVRLVINLRHSWGQTGREKLSKTRFGTGKDKSMPVGRVGTRVGCIGQGLSISSGGQEPEGYGHFWRNVIAY